LRRCAAPLKRRAILTQNAGPAALAIESGCEWITADRDLGRFHGPYLARALLDMHVAAAARETVRNVTVVTLQSVDPSYVR
jgi:hypothetical protein